ncbi:hypothetical protein MSPP1_003932 [Malassezia sp. CBS 17886]|nr:hypothetical protein MSPP1_003932 [Malassezia sp. CBS 17886]
MLPALRELLSARTQSSSSSEALTAYYADLSGQRTSNAAAFRARVDWWAGTIAAVCWRGLQGGAAPHALVFHMDDAVPTQWAIAHVGRPVCLAVVVDVLCARGALVGVAHFMHRAAPLHQGSFAQTLTAWIARPAWRQVQRWVGVGGGDEVGDEAYLPMACGDWVVVANVECFLDAMRASPRTLLDAVVSREEARRLILRALASPVSESTPARLTSLDVDVLLIYLARDAHAIVVDGETVKILRPGDARSISEAEHGIVAVRTMQERLSAHTEELHERSEAARGNARRAVQMGHKDSAAAFLRTKKQIDELHAKRVDALSTVAALLLRLEQAAGDAEVMRVYDASAGALRTLLSDPALQRNTVERTLDELADAVGEQEEIHEAIAGAAPQVSDEELAAELEALSLGAGNAADAPAQTGEAEAA